MTKLLYDLPASVLENLKPKEEEHDDHPHAAHAEPKAKPKLTLRWLFQPEEHADLAVWSLSVTFGTVWALIVGMFTLMAMNGTGRGFTNLLEVIYPGYKIPDSPVAFDALINLGLGAAYAFVHGCLFGLVLGLLYHRFTRPLPYGVRFKGRIKSGELVQLQRRDNQTPAKSAKPYTVLILANPFIQTSSKLIPVEKEALRVDPIMQEPELFQMKVACILSSLAYNKTIAPYLDHMRIIALFDPKLAEVKENTAEPDKKKREAEFVKAMKAHALCLENQIDLLIEPAQRIFHGERHAGYEDRLLEFLKPYQLDRVDVVFAITASETHTRSSSRFAIEKKTADAQPDFHYLDTVNEKEYPGYYNAEIEVPGMVAYSAWDLRLKTPVHEFAHAMSSNLSGLIDDEYHDGALQHHDSVFVLNKRHGWTLDKNNDGTLQASELPEVFAEIRENGEAHKFGTDKLRALPEDWKSYVPQRPHYQMPCTMDDSGEVHDFDLLLQHFITRRLEEKV